MKSVLICLIILCTNLSTSFAQKSSARLLREPDVYGDKLVFTYGGDIWLSVIGSNEKAIRLTSSEGIESTPFFSPDGKWIAFSGQYEGNTDVYIIPTEGGSPKRLTWHPIADLVKGWTPDGTSVIFTSGRESAPIAYKQFYTIDIENPWPVNMNIGRGANGTFNDDATYFAYEPIEHVDKEWRNYRGGQNKPIRILDLESLDYLEIPWINTKDKNPVWVGDTVFFLSDADFLMNLYSYNIKSKALKQHSFFKDMDIKYLATDGKKIVLERAGYLWEFNPLSETTTIIPVTLNDEANWQRPEYVKATEQLNAFSLSPSGVRILIESRGEILSVATEDTDDYIKISETSAAREHDAKWSPDGAKVAYFTDVNGEYDLLIKDLSSDTKKMVGLKNDNFCYDLQWAPDSKHILYTDTDRKIWVVNTETDSSFVVDQDNYTFPERSLNPKWSPDSKYIAYAKRMDNLFRRIFVYDMETEATVAITAMSVDATEPNWDPSGKYLWFAASNNYGVESGWLDMSSLEKEYERSLYLVALQKDIESPFLPKRYEESPNAATLESHSNNQRDSSYTSILIDFEGVESRVISTSVTSSNIESLHVAAEGVLFYLEGGTLYKYDLNTDESAEFLSGIWNYTLSFDNQKMAVWDGANINLTPVSDPQPSALAIDKIQFEVNLKQEWRQIFEDAWRLERDYFYDKNLHGAQWDSVYLWYSQLVDHVSNRNDLNYVLDMMGGELSVGHSFTGGGDIESVDYPQVGLLGVDWVQENGAYRVAAVYKGGEWNPDLYAPANQLGNLLEVGDVLYAVNGTKVETSKNVYSYFMNSVNRPIDITIKRKKHITEPEKTIVLRVKPTASEVALRRYDWVEANRKKVDELSNGQLAYVWLPNTGDEGYAYFNRYYFAQQDKKGAIIDERFNGGGLAADYIIDVLSRKQHGYFSNPTNRKKLAKSPAAGIYGPKVMLINDRAGSGGDLLPYMFKYFEIGPLVGTTTWGGLVGIWDTPSLVDGGMITAPRGAFINMDGEWAVENEGVAPDLKVENTPKDYATKTDAQLKTAVDKALQMLKQNPANEVIEPDGPIRAIRPSNY